LNYSKLQAELLLLLVGCWLRCPADCRRSRLTALLLDRLLGVLALYWCSLDRACCSVKPYDARELIWLVSTLSLHWPAPVAGYISTARAYRANTRTALLELKLLPGLTRLANRNVFLV
jgi:hypothetical protein